MNLRNKIDIALNKLLPPAGMEPKALHRAMRYSVFSGGKRLRPMIFLESARACGANYTGAMPAACAVELVHTYSLIHDDLPAMDDDNWRRGKPSCHKAFGEGMAILAGDALLTLAFGILAESRKSSAAMVKTLADAIGSKGMAGGQALDIAPTKHKSIERINRLKTGKLFEVSARLGAMSSGADKKDVSALSAYGAMFGAAFQIADDISDREPYKEKPDREKAARRCRGYIEDAKAALGRFGRRADKLRLLAESISGGRYGKITG